MITLKSQTGLYLSGFVFLAGAGILLGIVFENLTGVSEPDSLVVFQLGIAILLFLCGIALILISGRQYLWVGETTFGYVSRWPFEPMYQSGDIDAFVGIVDIGGSRGLLIKGRGPVPVPEPLQNQLWELQAILLRFQGRSPVVADLQGYTLEPLAPSGWPLGFSFEGEGVGKPKGAPLVDLDPEQPDSLRQLIHQYDATAIFWEAFPPAFEMVKVLMGLKRSNGGLILIGVHPSARVVGLSEEEFAAARSRMKRTAGEMTNARVEIGRLDLAGKIVLFAVFNATVENMAAIGCFQDVASEVVVV